MPHVSPPAANTLYYGDNLPILRDHVPDASVDLVYLDPPFNSNRSYNVLFKDEHGAGAEAQIQAFEDTWHWGADAEATYHDLLTDAPAHVGQMIGAMRQFIGTNQMLAYLVMMTARLVELHRVLKPTGSLYLHCDPTASHYLKVILDTIFGPQNFRNEIIWRRTRAHNDQKITRFGAVHDTILFYAKGTEWTFNKIFTPRDKDAPRTHDLYRYTDGIVYRKDNCLAPGGRGPRYEWNGHTENWRFTEAEARRLEAEGRIVYSKTGMPRILRPVDPDRGSPLQDVWADIDAPNSGSAEILGYPTQKPLALLERIIAASSNPGDIVLDPFCGCGTAVAAAHKLGRKWIGIDITHLATALQRYRMESMFPGCVFDVIGEPEDIESAHQLAIEDRFQFQYWALSLVPAKPLGAAAGSKVGKKGSDRGIDGVTTFPESRGAFERVLYQVKSGHVGSPAVRDLRGTLEREHAAMGVFITLEQPTREMQREAAEAGFYQSPNWGKYPKLQLMTIADLLGGKKVDMPTAHASFPQAPRVQLPAGQQLEFEVA